ncbi:MAG TPA: carboxypeptidase regulatory-like domain-containing protein, partial [Pyrinomonadaceae bacterium]|nr:carboxypeptidase regulatory-like domain-containing protein [Pyrinomonadaceae bacterium]
REETDYTPPRTFTFSVEQSFLGLQTREVEVSTGMGGGDCGYAFKVGSRYVVYAYQFSKANRLTTSICSRTKLLDEASEDLEFLRSLGSQSPGVTVYGEVKRSRQVVATGDSIAVGPLENIGLVVEGENERRETRTDKEGRYSLTGLRPGKFKVTVALPDELFTHNSEREITVADKGCAGVSFPVVDNGRLSGRVVNPEGQPAAGVLLALMDADHLDPQKDQSKLAEADKEGRYSFSALPPGRYLLAVNLRRFPDPNDPTNAFPRTYYPGVTDIAKAELITLGAGENVRERDLLLPIRRARSILSGKVVWADGTPVANAGISFREVTYHDPKMNYGIQADDQGYFTIEGFVGQTFVIEARSNRQYSGDLRRFEPMERVEPVRIVLTHPTENVKIVITKLR